MAIWNGYLQNLERYCTPTLDRNNDFVNWIRNLDIVANPADFTLPYKMRLDKVTGIVFWKRVQDN